MVPVAVASKLPRTSRRATAFTRPAMSARVKPSGKMILNGFGAAATVGVGVL